MFDSLDQDLCPIIKALEMWNIQTENMRGLGYDNGAEGGGGNGLQKAIFVPFLCLVQLICSI